MGVKNAKQESVLMLKMDTTSTLLLNKLNVKKIKSTTILLLLFYEYYKIECDFSKCARCSGQNSCEAGYEIPVGCKLVNVDNECFVAEDNYFIDTDKEAKGKLIIFIFIFNFYFILFILVCDTLCDGCDGPSSTDCIKAKAGYYFFDPPTN